MKLYLIFPVDEKSKLNAPRDGDFGCTQRFVIRAGSTKQTRKIAADNCGGEGGGFWMDPDTSTVEELRGFGKPGVIIEDRLYG